MHCIQENYDYDSLLSDCKPLSTTITADTLKKYVTWLRAVCGDDMKDMTVLDALFSDFNSHGENSSLTWKKLNVSEFKDAKNDVRLQCIKAIVDGMLKNEEDVRAFCMVAQVCERIADRGR